VSDTGGDPIVERPLLFFHHVMKTGGGTFTWYLRNQYGRGRVYPDDAVDEDLNLANRRIDYLLGLSSERHASLRAYTGHFPFVVSRILESQLGGEPLVRATLLRDPVERTLSYLKHCTIHHPQHRGLSLEEVYDDPFFFPGFIQDHQTKLFSMTVEDPLTTFFQSIDVDRDRLALAKENLEAVDLLGLTERFPQFVEQVRRRYRWRPLRQPDVHVSIGEWEVRQEFRDRIAEDNAIDMEFYDHARSVVQRRDGDEALDVSPLDAPAQEVRPAARARAGEQSSE
jgi:hypothetical protein